jgi:hypothetical protein
MGRRFVVSILVAAIAVLAATVSPAGADDAILKVSLTGSQERPGPGDPDAAGLADIYIDDDSNFLCLSMNWLNVDGTPSGLHIHIAPPTSPGPIDRKSVV